MTDEVVLREPWEDETLPSDLDGRRVRTRRRGRWCAASAPAPSATTRRSSSSPSLWRFPPLRRSRTGIRSRSVDVACPSGGEHVSVGEDGPVFTKYTGPAIVGPEQITLGPDGALWFANFSGPGSIGRITNAGVLRNLHRPEHLEARQYHGWPGPGVVVHEQQLDRADHHRRRRARLHRPEDLGSERDRFRAPTGPCGLPTTTTTRSGASPRRATFAPTPTRASRARKPSPSDPTAPCGSPTSLRPDRSVVSPPTGSSRTIRTRASSFPTTSPPGPTVRCGSPTTSATRSGGSRLRARSASTATTAS